MTPLLILAGSPKTLESIKEAVRAACSSDWGFLETGLDNEGRARLAQLANRKTVVCVVLDQNDIDTYEHCRNITDYLLHLKISKSCKTVIIKSESIANGFFTAPYGAIDAYLPERSIASRLSGMLEKLASQP